MNKSDEKKDIICVKYKDEEINVNLIYRDRKNITIQIKPLNNVSIISPKKVPKKVLKEMLIEKGDWILEKLEEYNNLEDYYKEKEYTNGEKFYYLGKKLELEIVEEKNNRLKKYQSDIAVKENKLIVNTNNCDKEYIKEALKDWYKKESERIVKDRVLHWKAKSEIMMKLNPSSLKVKEQKKRWGTCTSKKVIYINSKISMASIEAIDYILIHEFSHLIHMNHSKDFYRLVERIMPNYKKQKGWLKINGYKLIL